MNNMKALIVFALFTQASALLIFNKPTPMMDKASLGD